MYQNVFSVIHRNGSYSRVAGLALVLLEEVEAVLIEAVLLWNKQIRVGY